MSTFVLVHGAWHGAWCWHKVTPLLESRGHTVHTLDLPALGVDRTPVQSITLQSYADRVCETLSSLQQTRLPGGAQHGRPRHHPGG